MGTGGYRRFRLREKKEHAPDAALMKKSRMPVSSKALMSAVYGVDPNKFSSWEAFCVWCLLVGRASDVVIFSTTGELLAAEGDASEQDHVSLARYLHRLLSQPWSEDGAPGRTRAISAQRGEAWLTGFRFEENTAPEGSGNARPLIGLRGDAPLYHDARAAIVAQAEYTWQRLQETGPNSEAGDGAPNA